jgi:cell division protein FtsN
MISVPERPELELPDEELMNVSSLRNKLDDKGFLLVSDSDEPKDTNFELLETAPLTALDSNESYRFEDTMPLDSKDVAALGFSETVSYVPETDVSNPANETAALTDDTLSLHYDDTASLTAESFKETVNYVPDEAYTSTATEDVTPPPQQQQTDIWAEIRNEINANQQTQANIHPSILSPTPEPASPQINTNEIGPLMIEGEPQYNSGVLKYLLLGLLFLVLLAVGGLAVWQFVLSDSDEEIAQQTAPLKQGSNPSTSNGNTKAGNSNNQTANRNEKSVSNNNANTNSKNHSSAKTENKSSTTQNGNSQSSNSNSQNANNSSGSGVANSNSGGQAPAGSNQSDGKFTIQIGSYPNVEAANSKVAQLQSGGVPARVVVANIPRKGTWYRIHVGRFANREQAERYARELKSKGVAKELFITDVQ